MFRPSKEEKSQKGSSTGATVKTQSATSKTPTKPISVKTPAMVAPKPVKVMSMEKPATPKVAQETVPLALISKTKDALVLVEVPGRSSVTVTPPHIVRVPKGAKVKLTWQKKGFKTKVETLKVTKDTTHEAALLPKHSGKKTGNHKELGDGLF